MPISHTDQVNLLKDILSNHQMDCCGSVSECEQLERLIKSLMANSNVHSNVKNTLEQVYDYSHNGINASNLDEHIELHKDQLSQWVNDIDQYS
ncbi:YtzH-like family protein [Cytobacillus sp. Hz8]|uniref:YtzH-like family protein n=1 Tax=Cytobacillus sp. Hz8 TaxID=3347168 RepID=UPI0035DB401A